ncbi:asparaginase [Ilumatobacter coccineus]|uniref:Putative L-asparaginase II n=1 Tax=Ilumatobacter coccineus (strain NBRC 103263 / KCTC 29153 / YM16-304) TaxID=1313172 RepID=A0A6C7E8K8_ILUCY|nr:asparaginase [Ilumatobacter coccineus]BAN03994.1 putative L-asparaginase II [Ilumatobacter coccineus YM16-304]
MTIGLASDSVEVIATVTRNDVDESLHHGLGVVLGADGSVVASIGDIDAPIYPRSSLKPFQAAAMVDAGLDLPGHLLALAASSHSGEARHLDGTVEILQRHGLGVEALRNTPARPYGAEARAAARAAGIAPSSLQQNCSGKHAAMLATCVVNGWSIDDYLALDHPLQVAISSTIEALGATVEHVGIDGCGAPTHVLSLIGTARAIREIAVSGSPVGVAMNEHPLMVGGTGRDVSEWIAAVPGLVAKDGAQGVMVLALPDGRAAALKIADGSDEVRRAVTVQALRHLGVDVDGEHAAVRDRVAVRVLGHGEPVGSVVPRSWS